MLIRKTAVNFAKALFAVPSTREEIQKRQEDLENLVGMVRENSHILQLLCYPELSVEERLKTVEKLLNLHFDLSLKSFLDILLKRRKANYLITIAAEYRKLVVNDLKSLDVDVQSTEPLSESIRNELVIKLENKFKKKINLIETINPKLLSGFVLLIGNKLLDLSIKGKLTQLKQLILKGEV